MNQSEKDFQKNLMTYSNPSLWKSIWQISNSFIPYLGLWVLIIYSLSISYWITAGLILLAAGFLVRLFIIFHDCGHGSFFKSKKANRIVGSIFGILAFTPYDKWHNQHMKHHATVGNLDKRGVGDVWTMTKEEFEKSDKKTRIKYKIYRNPFIMFGLGPIAVFLVTNRFTYKWMTKKEKRNIWLTNLMLLLIFTGMGLTIGFFTFLILQLLILFIAGIAGFWLFYLQHQYEDVSWYRQEEWDFITVALEGSSYIKFPKILQWFSGNIGFHHIHHMNARIPNYNLQKCYKEFPIFKKIKPITFLSSLKTLKFRLWDEDQQKLVGY
ncbi:MAG: fatty acid desaturase [Prolixibacteraceae bacterium]|nr:fatty acid desaturase [Prolixibacteraceae bacterium]